jgi:hypothetical protein
MESLEILKIIHIDICGLFNTSWLNGQRYFISFINDNSIFIYFYLLFDKVETLNAFKTYKVEVEKQKGKYYKVI